MCCSSYKLSVVGLSSRNDTRHTLTWIPYRWYSRGSIITFQRFFQEALFVHTISFDYFFKSSFPTRTILLVLPFIFAPCVKVTSLRNSPQTQMYSCQKQRRKWRNNWFAVSQAQEMAKIVIDMEEDLDKRSCCLYIVGRCSLLGVQLLNVLPFRDIHTYIYICCIAICDSSYSPSILTDQKQKLNRSWNQLEHTTFWTIFLSFWFLCWSNLKLQKGMVQGSAGHRFYPSRRLELKAMPSC